VTSSLAHQDIKLLVSAHEAFAMAISELELVAETFEHTMMGSNWLKI